MNRPEALTLTEIGKVFFAGTANEVVALDGIDLAMPAGQFVTVIGSNGAGKSTLLNAVAGTFPVTWMVSTAPAPPPPPTIANPLAARSRPVAGKMLVRPADETMPARSAVG